MADVAASQLELPEDMMYDSEEEDELVAALHLATYVPLQVVKTFVERRRSLTQPVKEHFPATVLFADISGFTKLADKLSKKDNGVALLTDIINSLFDPVIAIVTEYGGDVVKFAGDALQVMFPVFSTPSNKASPKSQLALSVVAAVECGLHLNEFIEQMNTTGPAAADARRGSASSSTTGGHTGKRSNWKRLTQVVKRRGLLGIWSSLRHKSNAAAAGGSRPVSLARNQGLSLYQLYNNYRQKTPAPGKAMSQRRFFASPTAQGNRGSSRGLGAQVVGPADNRGQAAGVLPFDGEAKLRMKVSIAAGLVLGMHTGGVGSRWEYFIAGDPLKQITEAEAVAEPGYVVLHEKAWKLLQQQKRHVNMVTADLPKCPHQRVLYLSEPVLRVQDNWGANKHGTARAVRQYIMRVRGLRMHHLDQLAKSPSLASLFRGYLQRAVLDRIDSLQTEWVGELRKLTVLFIMLPGVTEGADDQAHSGNSPGKNRGMGSANLGSSRRPPFIGSLRQGSSGRPSQRVVSLRNVHHAQSPALHATSSVPSMGSLTEQEDVDGDGGDELGELVVMPTGARLNHQPSSASSASLLSSRHGLDGPLVASLGSVTASPVEKFVAHPAFGAVGDSRLETMPSSFFRTPKASGTPSLSYQRTRSAAQPADGSLKGAEHAAAGAGVGAGAGGGKVDEAAAEADTLLARPDLNLAGIQVSVHASMKVLAKYEGTVRQFIVDDKGAVLIGAFGVAPFGHEDDERRGVMAAVEIHNALVKCGTQCAIGVATGNVFCGNVGGRSRREYALVGDAVNTSARLMAYARKKVVKSNAPPPPPGSPPAPDTTNATAHSPSRASHIKSADAAKSPSASDDAIDAAVASVAPVTPRDSGMDGSPLKTTRRLLASPAGGEEARRSRKSVGEAPSGLGVEEVKSPFTPSTKDGAGATDPKSPTVAEEAVEHPMFGAAMCNRAILIDERTYSVAKKHVHFQALGSIKVKGKIKPLHVFTPELSFGRPTADAPRAHRGGSTRSLISTGSRNRGAHPGMDKIGRQESRLSLMTEAETPLLVGRDEELDIIAEELAKLEATVLERTEHVEALGAVALGELAAAKLGELNSAGEGPSAVLKRMGSENRLVADATKLSTRLAAPTMSTPDLMGLMGLNTSNYTRSSLTGALGDMNASDGTVSTHGSSHHSLPTVKSFRSRHSNAGLPTIDQDEDESGRMGSVDPITGDAAAPAGDGSAAAADDAASGTAAGDAAVAAAANGVQQAPSGDTGNPQSADAPPMDTTTPQPAAVGSPAPSPAPGPAAGDRPSNTTGSERPPRPTAAARRSSAQSESMRLTHGNLADLRRTHTFVDSMRAEHRQIAGVQPTKRVRQVMSMRLAGILGVDVPSGGSGSTLGSMSGAEVSHAPRRGGSQRRQSGSRAPMLKHDSWRSVTSAGLVSADGDDIDAVAPVVVATPNSTPRHPHDRSGHSLQADTTSGTASGTATTGTATATAAATAIGPVPSFHAPSNASDVATAAALGVDLGAERRTSLAGRFQIPEEGSYRGVSPTRARRASANTPGARSSLGLHIAKRTYSATHFEIRGGAFSHGPLLAPVERKLMPTIPATPAAHHMAAESPSPAAVTTGVAPTFAKLATEERKTNGGVASSIAASRGMPALSVNVAAPLVSARSFRSNVSGFSSAAGGSAVPPSPSFAHPAAFFSSTATQRMKQSVLSRKTSRMLFSDSVYTSTQRRPSGRNQLVKSKTTRILDGIRMGSPGQPPLTRYRSNAKKLVGGLMEGATSAAAAASNSNHTTNGHGSRSGVFEPALAKVGEGGGVRSQLPRQRRRSAPDAPTSASARVGVQAELSAGPDAPWGTTTNKRVGGGVTISHPFSPGLRNSHLPGGGVSREPSIASVLTMDDLNSDHGPASPSARSVAPLATHRSFLNNLQSSNALVGGPQSTSNRSDLGQSGRHSVILITGLPGMGRSTVLNHVAHMAATYQGLTVAVGTGMGLFSSSYRVWRNVFVTLLGLRGQSDPAAVLAALAEKYRLDKYTADLVPLLNDLLALRHRIPENDLTRGMPSSSRADNLRHLLVSLLNRMAAGSPDGRVAPRGFVIMLKDCEHMDAASALLLTAVVKVPNVLVVASLRSKEAAAAKHVELAQMLADPRTLVINCGPLSQEQVEVLICSCLGTATVDYAITAAVHQRAMGTPLFVVQLCQVLRELELVTRDGDHCRLAHGGNTLDASLLPDSMHGYVASLLDKLSVRDQLVLRIASACGHLFSTSVIQDVHPDNLPSQGVLPDGLFAVSHEEVLASLNNLVTARLLRAVPAEEVPRDEPVVAASEARDADVTAGRVDLFRTLLVANGIVNTDDDGAVTRLTSRLTKHTTTRHSRPRSINSRKRGSRADGAGASHSDGKDDARSGGDPGGDASSHSNSVPGVDGSGGVPGAASPPAEAHTDAGPAVFFEFASVAVQEVVYTSMPYSHQQRLHELIACWFEQDLVRAASHVPGVYPDHTNIHVAVACAAKAADGFGHDAHPTAPMGMASSLMLAAGSIGAGIGAGVAGDHATTAAGRPLSGSALAVKVGAPLSPIASERATSPAGSWVPGRRGTALPSTVAGDVATAEHCASIYTTLAPILAYHWARTPHATIATRYLEAAAELALQRYANDEALVLMRVLVGESDNPVFAKLDLDPLQEARWQRRIAIAYLDLGSVRRAEARLHAALRLLGITMPGRRSMKMRARMHKAGQTVFSCCLCHRDPRTRNQDDGNADWLANAGGDEATAATAGGAPPTPSAVSPAASPSARAAQLARLAGTGSGTARSARVRHMEEASESLLILARTAFLLGSTELQVYCLLRALALARKRGPSACLAKAYSACALWRTALGLSQRRALGFCLNAHDLAHDLKDVGLELKVLTITCRFYMQCGNWRKAAAGLSRASWLAESIGNTREWEQVVNQLATLTALEGDWAEASSLYKLASHSSFARDDREMYAISMIGVASSNLRLGMVEHAQAELTEAMTVGSITSPATLIRFNGLAAAIMVAQGQRDTAIRLAVEAAQLVWLGGMQPEQYSSAEGLTLTLDVLLGLVAEWAFDLRAAKKAEAAAKAAKAASVVPASSAVKPSEHTVVKPLRAISTASMFSSAGRGQPFGGASRLAQSHGRYVPTALEMEDLVEHIEHCLGALEHLAALFVGVQPLLTLYRCRLRSVIGGRGNSDQSIRKALVAARNQAASLHLVPLHVEIERTLTGPLFGHSPDAGVAPLMLVPHDAGRSSRGPGSPASAWRSNRTHSNRSLASRGAALGRPANTPTHAAAVLGVPGDSSLTTATSGSNFTAVHSYHVSAASAGSERPGLQLPPASAPAVHQEPHASVSTPATAVADAPQVVAVTATKIKSSAVAAAPATPTTALQVDSTTDTPTSLPPLEPRPSHALSPPARPRVFLGDVHAGTSDDDTPRTSKTASGAAGAGAAAVAAGKATAVPAPWDRAKPLPDIPDVGGSGGSGGSDGKGSGDGGVTTGVGAGHGEGAGLSGSPLSHATNSSRFTVGTRPSGMSSSDLSSHGGSLHSHRTAGNGLASGFVATMSERSAADSPTLEVTHSGLSNGFAASAGTTLSGDTTPVSRRAGAVAAQSLLSRIDSPDKTPGARATSGKQRKRTIGPLGRGLLAPSGASAAGGMSVRASRSRAQSLDSDGNTPARSPSVGGVRSPVSMMSSARSPAGAAGGSVLHNRGSRHSFGSRTSFGSRASAGSAPRKSSSAALA